MSKQYRQHAKIQAVLHSFQNEKSGLADKVFQPS
jgi:hypothetical protein